MDKGYQLPDKYNKSSYMRIKWHKIKMCRHSGDSCQLPDKQAGHRSNCDKNRYVHKQIKMCLLTDDSCSLPSKGVYYIGNGYDTDPRHKTLLITITTELQTKDSIVFTLACYHAACRLSEQAAIRDDYNAASQGRRTNLSNILVNIERTSKLKFEEKRQSFFD